MYYQSCSDRYNLGGAIGLDGTDIQNGDDLILESGNSVIAVVVQYRLGLFGFLPGQKVKQGGALNAGLRRSPYTHFQSVLFLYAVHS